MKLFTDADIKVYSNPDFPMLHCDRSELVNAPLDWQKRGLQQTASGYGGKLTMNEKINFNGKLYRLYCTCYSNSGSVWFKVKGRTIYVN